MDKRYKLYTHCRFCKYKNLTEVIDLGNVPLAGGFITSERNLAQERLYPLTLNFCSQCFLLQTNIVINKDILFKNYFYFSSKIKTLVDHFEKTAKELKNINSKSKGKFIVEIGCNDGSFLKACLTEGWSILGIDPATNVVNFLIKEGLPVINDYFSKKLSGLILSKYGKADVIFSSNTLAHIEDMNDVISGIKNLMKKNGVFIFEVHYLGSLIHELQYDMIYHEHQYYYSLHAIINLLKKYGLEIFDIKLIPVHAGSIRIYAKHKRENEKVKNKVMSFLKKEKEQGLTIMETFRNYGENIKKTKKDLLVLLNKLKKKNKKIAGYGASGRATVIMNYCGLDSNILEYIIDDSPVKQGSYTPGNHLKIVSSNILATQNRPDYILVFAWSFMGEIKKRNQKFLDKGGKFIIPLPKVKII